MTHPAPDPDDEVPPAGHLASWDGLDVGGTVYEWLGYVAMTLGGLIDTVSTRYDERTGETLAEVDFRDLLDWRRIVDVACRHLQADGEGGAPPPRPEPEEPGRIIDTFADDPDVLAWTAAYVAILVADGGSSLRSGPSGVRARLAADPPAGVDPDRCDATFWAAVAHVLLIDGGFIVDEVADRRGYVRLVRPWPGEPT